MNKTLKIEKTYVDGVMTVSAIVNGKWMEDCEVSSQFSVNEIKEYYKQKYL